MRYTLQVQLSPKVHDSNLKYYWNIDLHTEDGQFTVKHGYEGTIELAIIRANTSRKELGLVI